jgi:hypothetical protein
MHAVGEAVEENHVCVNEQKKKSQAQVSPRKTTTMTITITADLSHRWSKRDLLQRQQCPAIEVKETYHNITVYNTMMLNVEIFLHGSYQH